MYVIIVLTSQLQYEAEMFIFASTGISNQSKKTGVCKEENIEISNATAPSYRAMSLKFS